MAGTEAVRSCLCCSLGCGQSATLAVTTATFRPSEDCEVVVVTKILKLFLRFDTPLPKISRTDPVPGC